MSSSTIVYRSPKFKDKNQLSNDSSERSSALLILSLWLFACIFSVAKSEFSSNMTGISISFNMQDVLFMGFACWLLHKGLSSRNVILVIPWMTMTIYSLYYNHYRGITKMILILKHSRSHQTLPWLALLISTIGLFIRVLLTLRILQLSANLWYRKKLEKELYK
ncbi:unnamed protein product [Brassicogethes aeneus]|uniref:Uncharacterized protein n=1 Tax=Brassicogethes aeneus TaxID=1431903 RepID=A0A9P0BH22_BRAAE|nr:unnamed protein product [Brassicogethes aeneus]